MHPKEEYYWFISLAPEEQYFWVRQDSDLCWVIKHTNDVSPKVCEFCEAIEKFNEL